MECSIFKKYLKCLLLSTSILGGNQIVRFQPENTYNTFRTSIMFSPFIWFSSGPYKWRDIRTPKEILNDVCQVKPKYIDDTRVIVNGKTFDLSDFGKSRRVQQYSPWGVNQSSKFERFDTPLSQKKKKKTPPSIISMLFFIKNIDKHWQMVDIIPFLRASRKLSLEDWVTKHSF